MNVFPAFDANYKTRKRTFKCCSVCRNKRLKCNISSGDYEINGCDNCKEGGKHCDLIVDQSKSKKGQKGNTNISNQKKHDFVDNQYHTPQDQHLQQNHQPLQPSPSPHPAYPPVQQHQYPPQHHQMIRHLQPGSYYHHQFHNHNQHNQSHLQFGGFVPPNNPAIHVQAPLLGSSPNERIINSSPADLQFNQNYDRVHGLAVQSSSAPMQTNAPINQQQISHDGSNAINSSIRAPMMPVNSSKECKSTSNDSMPLSSNLPKPQTVQLISSSQPKEDKSVQNQNSGSTTTHSSPLASCPIKTPSDSLSPPNNSKYKVTPSISNQSHSRLNPERVPRINTPSITMGLKPPYPPITAKFLKKTFDFNTSSLRKFAEYDTAPTSQQSHKVSRFGRDQKHYLEPRIESDTQFEFLVSIDAFSLSLDKKTIKELVSLYFFKINSILPILYEPDFWTDFNQGTVPNIILYALILSISRDKLAEKIFIENGVYTKEELPKKLIKFYEHTEFKIRQLLLILRQLDDNKLSLLICHLLLTLNYNFNRLGAEQSSKDLSEAKSHALDLGIPMRSQQMLDSCHSISNEKKTYFSNLWWVIIVLDRFNCVSNSKLVIYNRWDFPIQEPKEQSTKILVNMAKILEFTLIKYFNPSNLKWRENDLDLDEIIDREVKIHEKDMKTNFSVFQVDYKKQDYYLPQMSLDDYKKNAFYLLERLTNNLAICACNKERFDRYLEKPGNTRINDVALVASLSISDYINYFSNQENLINIPWITICLSLSMGVFLKHKIRAGSKKFNDTSIYPQWNKETMLFVHYFTYKLLEELDAFSAKWWLSNEVVIESRALNEHINKKIFAAPPRNSMKREVESETIVETPPEDIIEARLDRLKNEASRKKVKIQSLLSDEDAMASESTNRYISISTPSYYTKLEEEGEQIIETNDKKSSKMGVLPTPEFIKNILRSDWKALIDSDILSKYEQDSPRNMGNGNAPIGVNLLTPSTSSKSNSIWVPSPSSYSSSPFPSSLSPSSSSSFWEHMSLIHNYCGDIGLPFLNSIPTTDYDPPQSDTPKFSPNPSDSYITSCPFDEIFNWDAS